MGQIRPIVMSYLNLPKAGGDLSMEALSVSGKIPRSKNKEGARDVEAMGQPPGSHTCLL